MNRRELYKDLIRANIYLDYKDLLARLKLSFNDLKKKNG